MVIFLSVVGVVAWSSALALNEHDYRRFGLEKQIFGFIMILVLYASSIVVLFVLRNYDNELLLTFMAHVYVSGVAVGWFACMHTTSLERATTQR